MPAQQTSAARSYNMSRIRAKNTSPEIAIRKALFKRGLRYRLHVHNLPGKPDIVFSKQKTIIFIHGCFWHSHPGCKRATMPKSNIEYWNPKITNNTRRDQRHYHELEALGWRVYVVWECQTKGSFLVDTVNDIIKFLDRPRL
jgi:DNA mismatch endonuclease (patch repair protein)